ncbi:nitronate monooxygenase [Nitriliruptor alkaliphilus]|uniref:nitronate monooxygenase n=1 Tax=Nitriliruptor alkaliphilus TaxID=427918 RepID=UPI00069880F7
MGVGVSSWQLARAVALEGQLGVVSGTAAAVTLARRLGLGDPGGHVQRALDQFPFPAVAERVRARYLDSARPGAGGRRFKAVPRPSLAASPAATELTVVANFVEVHLAKHGHDGQVAINYLEKIQLPTLASLYGALLAGVDAVLMGAGVPARIPAVLDRLADHRPVTLPVTVADAPPGERHEISLDPSTLAGGDPLPIVRRPWFLAIVSSATMATFLAGHRAGSPDGFVVETPAAGGHNAPPRGRLRLDDAGEPVYGPRDTIDLDAIAALGLPYWLAGGYATPAGLADAREAGAHGIQVGTAFAFCDESGIDPRLRTATLDAAREGRVAVRTDPAASPTGYPFKVLDLPGTLSDQAVYDQRPRRCDLGYLRELYQRPDGRVGYRCPAEPVEDYLAKGGNLAETDQRRCLCNALTATIGLGQTHPREDTEPALVTAGDGAADLSRFLSPGATTYSARDVIAHLTGRSGGGRGRAG